MTLNDMSFYEGAMINSSHIQRKDTKRLKSTSSNKGSILINESSSKSSSFKRSKFFTKYLRSNGSPLINESSDKNRGLLKRSSYEFPYHFLH